MGRKLKKYYSRQSDRQINTLDKKGLKIFPAQIKNGKWRIHIASTKDELGKKAKPIGKEYDYNEIIDKWYDALDYFYDKYKQ